MKGQRILIGTLTLVLLLALAVGLTQAQGPVGTAFTYQGHLNDGGSPADGTYDFEFKLYDDSSGGSQVGITGANDVTVSDGLFTVELDFGGDAFTGDARWLGIGVRPGDSTGAYTTLTPRQALTPAPYALALPGLWTEPNATSPNVIGGYSGNSAGSAVGVTIGGGGSSDGINQVPLEVGSDYATIGGGRKNTARCDYATIGGGLDNEAGLSASIGFATVGGGYDNEATNNYATVGGGASNEASGQAATVPGGGGNTAQGDYSFAAGRRAKANRTGCFVWGDSTDADVNCDGSNQFIVRASGGVAIYTSSDLSTGVVLPAGSGSWSSFSNRYFKENLTPVDGREILARVAEIPITTWNYKSQDSAVRHIGPMAQDFYAAFGLGEDDKHISTVDADGVALAAAQGLYQIVQAQDTRIEALETENAALQQQLDGLEARVAAMEGQPGAPMARWGGWDTLGFLVGGLLVGLVVVGRQGMLGRSPGGE